MVGGLVHPYHGEEEGAGPGGEGGEQSDVNGGGQEEGDRGYR